MAPISPVPGTGSLLRLARRLIRKTANPKSLLRQRSALAKALSKAESRIVVVVDDIDRLEPSETREVMRLVRLMSDLPNLVFLLIYDSDRVAQSLDQDHEIGRSYLEKIVQLTYNMPSVRRHVLQRLFLDGLQELIEEHHLDPPVELQWSPIFFDVVFPLLRSLRDVKRLLYSLPVAISAVGNEVAISDLVGLEAIRVLRPKAFEALRGNASHLTGASGTIRPDALRVKSQDDMGNAISNMVREAGEDGELLESAIKVLFPSARGFLDGQPRRSFSSGTLRAQRRVGDEGVLRTYLQAGLDEGTIPAKEVRDFVFALIDGPRINTMLESLDEQKLEAVLGRLEDFEQDFTE